MGWEDVSVFYRYTGKYLICFWPIRVHVVYKLCHKMFYRCLVDWLSTWPYPILTFVNIIVIIFHCLSSFADFYEFCLPHYSNFAQIHKVSNMYTLLTLWPLRVTNISHKFSLQYHPWITHEGFESRGNDHKVDKLFD